MVVSHSYMIGGFPGAPSVSSGSLGLGYFSVACFFTISGYLISQSRLNSSVKSFLWKRALRIIPGYLIAYFLTSFLFSPIVGLIKGGWTFRDSIDYLVGGISFFKFGPQTIGETLTGLPHPENWNGSLWSVRVEALLYVATASVFLMSKLVLVKTLQLSVLLSSTIASILFGVGVLEDPSPAGILFTLCLFVPFYLAGSLVFLERQRIRLNTYTVTTMFVLATVFLSIPGFAAASAVPMAIVCLAVGSIQLPSTLAHFKRNDYSYGVYVLSFPIQQCLAVLGAGLLGVGWFIVMSLIFSLIFAILSWHLVEAQFLKLKNVVR